MTDRMPRAKPRRKKGRRQGAPRAPLTETVKMHSLGGIATGRVQFILSEDIVDTLLELRDRTWGAWIYATGAARYKGIRVQFIPFMRIDIPAVMIRIEPPTYDPEGHKLYHPDRGRRWICSIKASRLRIKTGIPTKRLDYYWADQGEGAGAFHGLIINFDDDDMIFPGPKDRRRVTIANPDLIARNTHYGRKGKTKETI